MLRKFDNNESELKDRLISLKRVSKVVKGGKRFSFSALVVVGDEAGRIGVGLGKAKQVPEAIGKGVEAAKRNLFKIPIADHTIHHAVLGKYGAGRVILKPAAPGTGVIAGGHVRAIVESAGIHNILTKSLRSNNPHNVVKATVDALKQLRSPEEVAALRGKKIEDII